MGDDVMKVRLTADGIKEVIDELKKVQNQVGQTAKAGKDAQDALGSLGTLFAARQIASFAANALEAAEALNKMQQKTGVAVETLSVLTIMANKADVSAEELEKGMVKLAKSADALQKGDATAATWFGELGISAEQIKGLSLDQILLKVANAQGRFADGAGKAAAMVGIFGKAGANLIPLLNELANGGYEKNRDKLQELGRVLSGEAAAAAEEFNDSLKDLKKTAEGAVVQMAQGSLPALTSAVKGLSEILATLPAGAKAFSGSFLLVGSAATAATVAVRSLYTALAGLGGVGIAVVALSAVVAGLLAWGEAERQAQAEAVKANQEQFRRVAQGRELVDQYAKETKALEKSGLGAKEREGHEAKLKKIKEDLTKLSPAFQDALGKEKDGYKSVREELEKKLAAEKQELENKKKKLQADLAEAQAVLEARKQNAKAQAERFTKPGFTPQHQLESQAMGAAISASQVSSAESEVKKLQAQLDALAEPEKKPEETKKPQIPVHNLDAGKAASAELAAAAKRLAEAQKQELEAYGAVVEDFYKEGLIGLEVYLEARRAAIAKGTDNEVALLEAQIKAEEAARKRAKTPQDKLAADTKLRDLQAQIDLKRNAGEVALQSLERKGIEERRVAAEEALKLESELATAKGLTGEAAIRAIESEYARRIQLAKTTAAKETLAQLRDNAISGVRVEGATTRTGQAQRGLDTAMADIDQRRAAGILTEAQAVDERIAAYQRWIPIMEANLQVMRENAQTTEQYMAVAEQQGKLDALKTKLREVADSFKWLKDAAKESLTNGIQSFLVSLTDSTTTLSDKIRALGLSITQSLAQAASTKIATTLTDSMGGLFSSGNAGAAAGGAALSAAGTTLTTAGASLDGAGAILNAAGGMLDGSGAALSTAGGILNASAGALSAAASELAVANSMSLTGGFAEGGYTGPGGKFEAAGLVHRGEFVFSQPAVRTLGVGALALLHNSAKMGALRGLTLPKGSLPGYAEGGLVGGAPASIPVSLDSRSRMEIGLDDGLILRALDTPEGAQLIVKHLSRHSKSANRALGRG